MKAGDDQFTYAFEALDRAREALQSAQKARTAGLPWQSIVTTAAGGLVSLAATLNEFAEPSVYADQSLRPGLNKALADV